MPPVFRKCLGFTHEFVLSLRCRPFPSGFGLCPVRRQRVSTPPCRVLATLFGACTFLLIHDALDPHLIHSPPVHLAPPAPSLVVRRTAGRIDADALFAHDCLAPTPLIHACSFAGASCLAVFFASLARRPAARPIPLSSTPTTGLAPKAPQHSVYRSSCAQTSSLADCSTSCSLAAVALSWRLLRMVPMPYFSCGVSAAALCSAVLPLSRTQARFSDDSHMVCCTY